MLVMNFKSICGSISAIVAVASLMQATPASAQLIPEPWVTLGTKDRSVSYGVGVKFFDFGAELGTGPNGVTGVDALKFFSFPVISPYAGLGLYGDRVVAYSGGVQFYPPAGNTFFGVGYHSIRGVSGQLGFKF
jgi:hypothetical protein